MTSTEQRYDVVIANGQVMDPESGLDAVRNVGIVDGVVRSIAGEPLRGLREIDAAGLVVAPGFIDLHSHGQDPENYAIHALDGVTTALELEVGTAGVDSWYEEREGAAVINYGASAGHIPARNSVMGDPASFLPSGDAARRTASDGEVSEITGLIERALQRGALAVGLGLQYVPAASRWEILEVFRVAARFGASCHVHLRGMGARDPSGSVEALEEVLAASAITGAPLHVVHVTSSGQGAAPRLLQMIGEARSRGLDVTTECYPYSAGMTGIESAIFDDGWQEMTDQSYEALDWADTGERLTPESFARYRKTGGMVIIHGIPDEVTVEAVRHPLTMIATDGYLKGGKGHPRTAGSYSRVLGRHVREMGSLTLMDALRKMSLMPAQRLESRVPAMSGKGRIGVGADADLVVFDPETVLDRATYSEPTTPPDGILHVLVGGVSVVEDGRLLTGTTPGKPVLAPAG